MMALQRAAAAMPRIGPGIVLAVACAPTAFAAPATAPRRAPRALPAAVRPASEAKAPGAAILPRSLHGIALGTGRADLELRLGSLRCRPSAEGFEVCRAAGDDAEIYLFRSRVVSLAEHLPPPADPVALLDTFIRRYGEPSLKGHTERDRAGRLHEIFGWKDDRTLEALRFVWTAGEPGERRVEEVVVTLWDRARYREWERERKRLPPPPTPRPTPQGT